MVVVRNIFTLKFGQSKEATGLWKQVMALSQGAGLARSNMRLLTDLAGPSFYTMVFETQHESLQSWEDFGKKIRGNADWQSVYAKICALTESGRREILSVIE